MIREPDFGMLGTGPSSGAYLYQVKLAGWPWKLPGVMAFKLQEQFHGPWLSIKNNAPCSLGPIPAGLRNPLAIAFVLPSGVI